MPFYEYECASCKYYAEVMQKISDAPLRKCPSCGKNALQKLVSAPVFRLKGSGWYETDFKSEQEKKRNLAGADKDATAGDAKESKADSGSESKSDAKGESKPAAKETEGSRPAKPVKASKPAPAARGKAGGAARKPAARTRTDARGGRKGR